MSRFGFPISLDVTNKRCLILGGGFEATDKARKLARGGATVEVIAEQIEPELRDMSSRNEVVWEPREWQVADLVGATLVMLTPDGKARAPELFRLATEQSFLLCAIDQPDFCHFANPATFHVGEMTVALSSGGHAPAILRRLREDLEAALSTPEMEAFVKSMSELRAQLPQEERISRLKEAVSGFGVSVEVTFPDWFERAKS